MTNIPGTSANDILFGTAGADTINQSFLLGIPVSNGTSGEDQLFGRADNDTLYGGSGNDRLNGGLGNDALNGGPGIDTADYSTGTIDPPGPFGPQAFTGATAGVMVNLNRVNAQLTGGAGIDTLVNIENLTGTNFNDLLAGNDANNVLDGLGGGDVLDGNAGNDHLLGGLGNDTLNGGTGNDLLSGGAGIDTASYSSEGSHVTVNLTRGVQNTLGAGIDTFMSIENLVGSNFNDALTGNDVNNLLLGLAGNDSLTGLAGNDLLDGGNGNDTLSGGLGNDQLFGEGGNDHLLGGLGNDLLYGRVGKDMLTGGGGLLAFDTFDYNAAIDSLPGVPNRDVITDFNGFGAFAGDQIDLTDIDANALLAGNQAFTYIGSAAFTAAGQLRYTGGVLQGSTDADATAEFEIQLIGAPTLTVGGVGTDILL